MNVWTHLIGVIVFIALYAHLFNHISLYPNPDKNPNYSVYQIWAMIIYMLSAIFCMGSSATYHLYYCMDDLTEKIWRRFDYVGISVLIIGSSVPIVYYAFYCEKLTYCIYFGFLFIVAGVVLCLTLTNRFSYYYF